MVVAEEDGPRECLFDLHNHSHNSWDSSVTPKEYMRRAREVGLKGLAITDHDHFTVVDHGLHGKGILWCVG